MFHSRAMEYRINRTQEKTFRLIYPNQNQLTFKGLVEKNKSINIHQRNFQTFATEILSLKTRSFLRLSIY